MSSGTLLVFASAVAVSAALSVRGALSDAPPYQAPPPAPVPTQVPASTSDMDALKEFEKQVAAYVAWRKTSAGTIGAKLTETASPAEIAARETALGNHIRQARATAKQGDIFNPVASKVFQRICTTDYRARTPQKKRLEQDEVPTFTIALNQTYPSAHPLATFPATLLAKLPQLPEEVEYRIVANHLILRDIEANVIVDYVPNVIP